MTLEDRLSTLLQEAASTMPTSEAAVGPEVRARRRRRQRRTAGSTLATAVIVVATFGVARVARTGGTISVAADRPSTTTIAPQAADADRLSESEFRDQTPPMTRLPAGNDRATMSTYRSGVPADSGPDLEWTEVAMPAAWDGGQMVWAAGQFVGAVRQASSVDLIASADGSQWSTVGSLPTTSSSLAFLAAGDHLVAWTDGEVLPSEAVSSEVLAGEVFVSEVFVSEDAGRSWEALGPIPPPDAGSNANGPTPRYVTRTRHLAAAAVAPGASGQQTVVLATITANDLDLPRLLADNGVEVAAVAYRLDTSGPATVSVCVDLRCSSEQTFTLPDLGLSAAEVAAVTSSVASTELWRSVAGGPLEQVPVEVRGQVESLTWANDHFLLLAAAGEGLEEETSLTRSTDGLTWDPLPVPSVGGVGRMLVSTDTAVFFTSWDERGWVKAQSTTDGGWTWGDGFGLPVAGSALQGGPSGLISVSAKERPPVTISKAGFTVSLGDQGVLVIDEVTNETVLSYDLDALTAEDTPETVIYQEHPYELTFLRPGSLEPMVTVTEADLLAAEAGMPSDFVVGWSADGSGWGWQSTTEAFGVAAWPSIVVGEGVVLSIVYGSTVAGVDQAPATAVPRMFVARTR